MPELTLVKSDEEERALREWGWAARDGRVLAVDTETTGLFWYADAVRLVQIGDRQRGWAVPVNRSRAIQDICDTARGPIAMHNAKFDLHFLREAGFDTHRWDIHDTRIMAAIEHPLQSHALKSLGAELVPELDPRRLERELSDEMARNGWSWRTVPLELPSYWQYAALDTVLAARLHERMPGARDSEAFNLEMAVLPWIVQAEQRGTRFNQRKAARTAVAQRRYMAELDEWAYCEYKVVLNSRASVAAVFDDLPLTPTGQPSLAKDVLLEIDHPVADALLKRRAAEKLAGFLESLALYATEDGRVHPDINQLAARSSRMAISKPALHQIPRTKAARGVFEAAQGRRLVLADYNQMELCAFAHLSGDAAMVRACHADDPHTEFAKIVWPGKEVTARRRQIVKNVTYAILYGAGPATLAGTAGIPHSDAATLLRDYKAKFPGVDDMYDRLAGSTSVTTWTGRELRTEDPHALVNYAVQGSCADWLKQAIVNCAAAGVADYLILPVHDELVFDVPAESAASIALAVDAAMRIDIDPPLTVDSKVVRNWGEAYA